jgi:hypothetical protein
MAILLKMEETTRHRYVRGLRRLAVGGLSQDELNVFAVHSALTALIAVLIVRPSEDDFAEVRVGPSGR